jgi:hypothetical protein
LVLQAQQHCEEGPVYLYIAGDQETEGDDMTYTEQLPPLPEPAYVSHDIPLFSSFQMMAYAQAALDALADEAEANIKEMIDKGLGQLPKEKT